MLLADVDIRDELDSGDIVIDPFDPERLQPASYDVALDDNLLWPIGQPVSPNHMPRAMQQRIFDPGADEQPMQDVALPARDALPGVWLPPGGVALGCTRELVALHPESALAADIAGCSSLGRWFLFVHVTAGFVDPGWSGRLTLELYNASPWWLRIWAGMRIAQLRIYRLESLPTRSYLDTGHYAGALTAMPSNYHG